MAAAIAEMDGIYERFGTVAGYVDCTKERFPMGKRHEREWVLISYCPPLKTWSDWHSFDRAKLEADKLAKLGCGGQCKGARSHEVRRMPSRRQKWMTFDTQRGQPDGR